MLVYIKVKSLYLINKNKSLMIISNKIKTPVFSSGIAALQRWNPD